MSTHAARYSIVCSSMQIPRAACDQCTCSCDLNSVAMISEVYFASGAGDPYKCHSWLVYHKWYAWGGFAGCDQVCLSVRCLCRYCTCPVYGHVVLIICFGTGERAFAFVFVRLARVCVCVSLPVPNSPTGECPCQGSHAVEVLFFFHYYIYIYRSQRLSHYLTLSCRPCL